MLNWVKMTTIQDVMSKINPLLGTVYTLPITSNKGNVGNFLEDLAGIPHTSNCLDCIDGEVKTVPLKKRKDKYVLKETIAITMLCKKDLLEHDFKSSKCFKKMSKMLIIPYLRDGDTIQFTELILMDTGMFGELYDALETDYNEIRKNYIESGILTSKTGDLLQNRTKGPGHGSTSRAFYLRPCILEEIQYIRTSFVRASGSLE